MTKMKDSGVEWIGKIPEGWEVRKIRHIAELNGRIGWQGLTTAEYIDEGPFLITGTDFINGIIDWKSCVHIPLGRWEEANQIQIKEGDLLITKDGTVGKVALATNIPDKASLNSGVLLIRNDITCEKKYLFWILNSYVFWKWFGIINSGNSTIIHLYQYDFYGFKFPFPPKETQQKIATYLDEKCSQIEQTIQNQQQVIEKLKAYKQSLITEAVTGKVKIQNGKVAGKYEQYKDSGVEWIGEIPSGWEVAKLKNLYKFLGGFAFNSDDYIEDSNNQILRIGNVKDFKILFDASPVYISNELAEKVDNFRLKPGYILFTMTGTRGKKDYFYTHEVNKNDCLKKNIFLNQRVGCLIPTANICSSYFNYILKEKLIKDSVFLTETGTANQANIGSEDVMKTKVHLPPKEEQKTIAEYLDKTCVTIDSAIEQKQKLIEKLTEYKKSLIYECVTGKKEI